jgi:hypothetical protein
MRNVMAIILVGVALLALPSPASPQVVTAAQVNGTWRDRT